MITLSKIYKNYDNLKVLKDVNLHVAKGEIYGLIGKMVPGRQRFLKLF